MEDGATFEENAIIKARHYGPHAPGLLFADDSGLEVDALGGAPGVFSARFCAEPAAPPTKPTTACCSRNCAAWRTARARFVCAIALVEDGAAAWACVAARWKASILDEPRGAGGFGYDPLFYCPPFGCTFGEASDEAQKFAVSHRGQALRAMLAALNL